MLSIVDLVTPRFGNADAAYRWLRTQPLPSFGGSTAMNLVLQGRGAEVIDYIKAIDAASPWGNISADTNRFLSLPLEGWITRVDYARPRSPYCRPRHTFQVVFAAMFGPLVEAVLILLS